MFKKLGLAALMAFSVISHSAHAAFLKTDVTAAGDAGAFVDQDTGIEWLSLKYTDGMSISQALAAYSGWRLPTEDEVITMAKAMFKASTIHYAVLPVADDGLTRYTSNGYSSCGGNAYCNIVQGFFYWFDRTDVFQSSGPSSSMNAIYLDEDNNVARISALNWYNNYHRDVRINEVISTNQGWVSADTGVFLVSDGGKTLSSIENPSLNINNPSSPINNPVEPEPEPIPTDVSAPVGMIAFALSFIVLGFRRKSM